MNNANPAVSVVIPAFNPGPYLLPAVQSILSQTFQDFELIVIDDGSTDGSFEALERIEDKRLRIERNSRNLGLVATRNKGINLSRAPLMAILDSDDIAKPDRLEKQVVRFELDPELALLGTCADVIDDDGRVIGDMDMGLYSHEEIRRDLLNGNRFVQSSVMLRVSAILDVGGYPSNFQVAEDYALWLLLAENFHLENLPERLVQYRIHGAQVSQKKIRLMRIAADQARMQAWLRLVDLGKTTGVRPPVVASFWQRLRGSHNTLGEDLLGWAERYRAANRRLAYITTTYKGLLFAPLSARLWKIALPTKLNIFYWWRRLLG